MTTSQWNLLCGPVAGMQRHENGCVDVMTAARDVPGIGGSICREGCEETDGGVGRGSGKGVVLGSASFRVVEVEGGCKRANPWILHVECGESGIHCKSKEHGGSWQGQGTLSGHRSTTFSEEPSDGGGIADTP